MKRRWIRTAPYMIACCTIGAGLLWMLTTISWSALSIPNTPVFVKYPAQRMQLKLSRAPGVPPPPDFGSPLVPYSQSTNKPVSDLDIKKIKHAIPWSKTVGRLYRPDRITVATESSTRATAEFWRGRKPLWVSLTKTNDVWQVEKIYSVRYSFGKLPTLWEKISEALPF